jgi:F-type H+-transporting ATPase subunit a
VVIGVEGEFGPRVIIWFDSGPFAGLRITETVIWAVIVAVLLAVFLLLSVRNLKRDPKGGQGVAELIVEYAYSMTGNNIGKQHLGYAPFVGTVFLFVLFANMLGMLGFRPVTSDVNATTALAVCVFLVIQGSGIRSKGIKGYLKHFVQPYPFLLPINILEEFTFPISLSFRLFGNILAGVIVMELVFGGLKKLSMSVLHLPIPLLQTVIPLPLNAFFDIAEPVLQAFVFTMLTMAFVSKAIAVHDDH